MLLDALKGAQRRSARAPEAEAAAAEQERDAAVRALEMAAVMPREGFDFSPGGGEPRAYRAGSRYRQTLGMVGHEPMMRPGWANFLTDEPRCTNTWYCTPANKAELAKATDTDYSVASIIRSGSTTRSEQVDMDVRAKQQDDMLMVMKADNEPFYNVTCYHTLYADGLEEVRILAADRAKDYYAAHEKTFRTVDNNQLASMLASSPLLVEDDVSVSRTSCPMPACTLGAAQFFTRRGLQDATGNDIGYDGTGGRVRLDMSRTGPGRPNMNVVLVGQSGMGKTTALRKLMLQWIAEGAMVIAIDPEGELRDYCRMAGGQYVNIGGGRGACISPTQPRVSAMDESAEGGAEVLADTISHMRTFAATQFGLGDHELSLLEQAMKRAYAGAGIGFDTPAAAIGPKTRYPLMGDIRDAVLEAAGEASGGDERALLESLAAKLWPACEGSLASIYNKPTSVTRRSDFVVLDTHSLEERDPATKAAQYYNVMSWVWDQIVRARVEDRPIKVVIDECHLVINEKSPGTTARIAAMIKRARKYNAGIVCATQQVEDLLFDPTILNQSTYRFLFGGDASHMESTVKMFDLTEGAKVALSRCERGDCIVLAGREAAKAHVEVREWERELFAEESRVTAGEAV